MKTHNVKQFLKEDFHSNTDPKTIGYYVGAKFDEAGLPNPYIEDHDQVDQDNDDRDGRGLPTTFALSAEPARLSLAETDAGRKLVFTSDNLE